MTVDTENLPYLAGVCRGEDSEGEPCGKCLLCRAEAAEQRLEQVEGAIRRFLADEIPIREPEDESDNPSDNYGRFRCGCTWDSGPYPVHCEKHDPEEQRLEGLRSALSDSDERSA